MKLTHRGMKSMVLGINGSKTFFSQIESILYLAFSLLYLLHDRSWIKALF